MTAFLWAINQLVIGQWKTGRTQVLYVSPLKALNNDIQRNLIYPLEQLRTLFEKENSVFPEIHVRTRSGDTPQSERRRMLRYPPDILITTPESLNLLLSSVKGQILLNSLSTVILDEIHSIISTKRGTHLITAVDRLIPLSGDFQRIGISATVKPKQTVAAYMGGYKLEGTNRSPKYSPRQIAIIQTDMNKKYDLSIHRPHINFASLESEQNIWDPLTDEFKKIIAANRSTLFFARSRRLSEILALKINQDEEQPQAYAHHGSLSKELRNEVENKLKNGNLKAIIATNSLELGIDIGFLDAVILVQAPPSISSAVQRIGRAGHQVGETSKSAFFPTHFSDLIESAVIADAVISGDIEAVKPITNALDVLSQIIISMAGTMDWDIDALYNQILSSFPYRKLSRRSFNLVLDMLSGRFEHSKIRELKPKIAVNRTENKISLRKGALLDLFTSGGTIPDRGYYHLRHEETDSLIGELDEEFVWEASPGQSFTFGTQAWKIKRITYNDVYVLPLKPSTKEAPFWKGEILSRDFHLSQKIALFLKDADQNLKNDEWHSVLSSKYKMDKNSIEHLLKLLKLQKMETKSSLPHRHHVLIEHVNQGPGSSPGNQIFIHTLWGARVNRPFALALQASLEKKYSHHLEFFVDNNCIVILLSHPIASKELFSLITPDNLIKYLKQGLEKTGFFGARFRENAGRALLINKRSFNKRLPLWMSRLRSKKLLSAVVNLKDFPILLETWRTCFQDEFDLESLKLVLEEISSGTIKVTECFTLSPSPMAGSVSWQQISHHMYADDSFPLIKSSQLSQDLFHDAVFDKGLRPAVPQHIIDLFEKKRQLLLPGYAPSPGLELVEWVKERQIIPQSEWNDLITAVMSTYPISRQECLNSMGENLIQISTDLISDPLIIARENHERLLQILFGKSSVLIKKRSIDQSTSFFRSTSPLSEEVREKGLYLFLKDWLMFYGPKQLTWIEKTLGIESSRLYRTIIDLQESESIIAGYLIQGQNQETICDAENFEILLRIKRAETIPTVEPRNIKELPLFLAVLNELSGSENNIQSLYRNLERLIGFTLPVSSWESDIFPSRIQGYKTQWLDTLIMETNLSWTGQSNQQIKFFFSDELDLIREKKGKKVSAPLDILPDRSAKYDFETLAAKTGMDPKDLAEHLWNNVWNGHMSNDTFSVVRKGIFYHFRYPENLSNRDFILSRPKRLRHHLSLSQWKESRILPGNWFLLPVESFESDNDLIEKEERNKDRVRILLDRYGLIFRELLHKESLPFRWQDLFRSLRLMELSGEVVSGYFFTGIPGPQFISPEALRLFRGELPKDHIFWISAVDPVSLCSLSLDPLRKYMPRRIEGTYLVYHGSRLIIILRKKGRDLTINIPPNELKNDRYFDVFKHLLTREFKPLRRLIIDLINHKPAPISPYIPLFKNFFEVTVDVKNVSLYKRI